MPETAVATVAKKKPDPREQWERKPLALQMRGDPEWKAWLRRAADFCRLSVPDFVDQSVAKMAREQGFSEPPPPR